MANWFTNYFRQSFEELRRVTWPSRKDTFRDTLVVIGVSLAVAVFLGLIDLGLTFGLDKLLQ